MLNKDYDLNSLSDGIPHMPRRLTSRERIADHLFFYMHITSWYAFILGGIIGYVSHGLIGCVILLFGGWLFGIWMRRSLGRRGRHPFHGFYLRIRERANGSPPEVLEWLVETLRGSGFTVSKCQAITAAYDRAMTQCRLASLPADREAILRRLDTEVKRISYSK